MEFEILLKIILSSLLGGIFGIDHEFSGKNGMMRTVLLIAAGSSLFTILSIKTANILKSADPLIMISLIIAGSGFIGSAAIIRSVTLNRGLITGTTIWVASGIGITVGLGLYLEAFLITVLIIILLRSFRVFDKRIRERSNLCSYSIKVKKRVSALTDIKKLLMECGINNYEWSLEKKKGGFILEITLSTSDTKNTIFIEKVLEMDDIEEVKSDNF